MIRMLLTVMFVLAMAGPETHACPIHSSTSHAPASHHQSSGHQKAEYCTCPQACCPAGGVTAVLAPAPVWSSRTAQVHVVAARRAASVVLPVRKHLQPLAHAPPLALA